MVIIAGWRVIERRAAQYFAAFLFLLCLIGSAPAQTLNDSSSLEKRCLQEAWLFRQDSSFYFDKWDLITATVDSLQSPHAHAWAHNTQAAQDLKDALALSTQDSVNGFPKPGDIRLPSEAIHTAHDLGRAHYRVYQDNLETNALNVALNSYRLALNLIDSLCLSQSHRESQSHVAEINDEVFAEMMDLLYLMYEKTQNPKLWEEMWYVSERNRSFQLFQSMLNSQKISSSSDAPFHQTYGPTPIADIQAQLLPDEHMLSYMYGKEKVWAMKLNAHDLKVQSVGSVESVDEGVQNMRKALTTYWEGRQTCQDTSENGCDSVGATAFTQQAHNVYHQIWRPSFDENGSFPQRVIVIPHGQLYLLPFGT
ncbi:MAG: hypothetical protein AAFV78_18185, partial [Bacteroidota bacterium]